MGGYTQDEVRRLIEGSERANKMKHDINFVFGFTISCMRFEKERWPDHTTICQVPIGKVLNGEYRLTFRRMEGGHMTIDLGHEIDDISGHNFWKLENGVEKLPLVFISPIYCGLPQVLSVASKMMTLLDERAHKLIEFAKS